MQEKIGFIGAGNMAEALVRGLLSSGTVKKKDLLLSDRDEGRLGHIKKTYGVHTTPSNIEIAETCDIVILAVKPGTVAAVLKDIRQKVTSRKIYVSIAAGVTTSFIKSRLKKDIKIVRVMPNTPCLVLEGACGIYFSELLDGEERKRITDIFSSVGETEIFPDENYIDAVTGLSGSGPAFVSIFLESLADGGVKMGLSRESSLKLAAQTVLGSARLVLDAGIKPAELKDMVSSPAGTTIEGIHVLEEKGLRNAVISAVEAATQRSREISLKGDD